MGSAQRGQCRTLAEPQLGKLKISCSSPSAQCWKRQGDQNRCTGETEGSSRSIQANISHNWRSTPGGTWQRPLPCIAITCVHGQKRQLPTPFPLHLLNNVNTKKNLLVLCTVHIMFQHMAQALWLTDRIALLRNKASYTIRFSRRLHLLAYRTDKNTCRETLVPVVQKPMSLIHE